MARIAGVNIPTAKRVVVGLQYIHGIGQAKAKEILGKVGIDESRRVNTLTDDEVIRIREAIDRDYTVEGDLRREVAMNIKRLMDLACYRGLRHRRGLPVHGQRTHTNARTRKGPAKAREILGKVGIDQSRRVNTLTDDEVIRIRETIDRDYSVEGDLRREVAMNIKRLMDLACYRGLRHRRGLPVHGQRTHTNARTRKGPAKPIAGKKKVTK